MKSTKLFENQDLFTVTELAKELKVSPKTIYGWIGRNEIPVRRIGRRLIRFEKKAIIRWISQDLGDLK